MAANLRFLRGTYANLQNQGVVDGSIYITTDEPGLYVDYKAPNETEVKRHRVGDYRIFANLDALKQHYGTNKPSTTCLYYLSESNILACYDGTTFKQINSQKTLDDLLSSFSTLSRVSGDGVEVLHTIGASGGDSHSASFSMESLNPTGLKITSGANANPGAVKFRVKETNTTAVLGTANNKLTLTTTTTGTGADGSAINSSDSSSIKFAGDGLTVSTTTAGKNAVVTVKNNDKLVQTVQNGSFVVTLQRNGETDNTSSATFTPKVLYGKGTQATASLNTNSQFELDVYTSGQVDTLLNQKLTAVNAMRFKGSVASQSDLPAIADKVQIGDTYIVSAISTFQAVANGSTSVSAVSAMPGDLLIARGTEAAGSATEEGYITEGLQWIYVPSADDTMTLSAAANGENVIITSQQGAADAQTVIQFASDEMIDIGFSNKTATISHKKQTTKPTGTQDTTEQESTDAIEGIITGIAFDDWGHITGYTYRNVTVHNTYTKSIAQSVKSGAPTTMTLGGSSTVLTTLTDSDNQTLSAAMTIAADTNSAVAIKAANGTGTAGPTITIGMVWTDF